MIKLSETPSWESHCERISARMVGKRELGMWPGEEFGRLCSATCVVQVWRWVVHQAGAPAMMPSKSAGNISACLRPLNGLEGAFSCERVEVREPDGHQC